MFERSLLESHSNRENRKSGRTFFISLLAHTLIVALIVLVPIWFVQGLPQEELLTFLSAPPPQPPPPPAPPAPVRAAPKAPRTPVDLTKFIAPTEVPENVPPPSEEIRDIAEIGSSMTGGAEGGVLKDVVGGGPATGGVLESTVAPTPPAPPPPPKRKPPVKVGGNVLQSKLVKRVDPVYPELAKRARVQGIVLLEVTVNEEGRVEEIKVVRGHPLLNDSAVEAVRQWVYSPTLLNNEPTSVTAIVTVNFTLR